MQEFEDLLINGKKIATLNSIVSLLIWDQETYMPQGAIDSRSGQIALLSSMMHEEKTSKSFQKKLEKLIDIETGAVLAKDLTPIQEKAIVEWRRDFIKDNKLPSRFVHQFSEITAKGTQLWAQARKENDFGLFSPTLEKIIELNREKAQILGYKDHPYDALLDIYEPSMTIKKIAPLFSTLEHHLSSLVQKLSAQAPIDDGFLYQNLDRNKQILFGNIVLDELNIDRKHMRLDESTHPFSLAMHPEDSRITTRLIPNNFMSNIYSILHEVGHGLYERNLPKELFGTPLCEALSYGIHESQSRFWETRIGKSEAFWIHFFPLLQEVFPKEFSHISLEKFYRAINAVKPNLIRVESDEISYCLHILLRYDIEKELIEGTLAVKDIPHTWNQKMKDLLGITPHSDTEGCLQDVHWSLGEFGYFPSYALGNLYASHFFKGFEKKHPDWRKNLSSGNLKFIKEFLKNNIHIHGRYYSQDELLQMVGGEKFSEKAYVDYLENKYHKIYRI